MIIAHIHSARRVGAANLDDSIINGEVIIDLNPNMSDADANVCLNGHIAGGRYTGTWKFIGHAGLVIQGTFEAVKK